MSPRKIYSIGIDGFEPTLLFNYMQHHNSRGFKYIYDQAYTYKLLSTDPPMSPPAWSSIISGLNMFKHGVFDFYKYNKLSGKIKLVDREDLPLTIFDIMDEIGLKQLLVNIPFFYPPKAINGVVISGLPAPTGSVYTYPKKLGERLSEKEFAVSEPPWTIKKDSLKKSIIDRSIFLNKLLERKAWDFTMAVYRETDIAQHFYWENKSFLYYIYDLIDKMVLTPLIDKIRDNHENAIIMIYGDHGFTKGKGTFHIMNLLYEKNLYTFNYNYKSIIKRKLADVIEKIYLSKVTPYIMEILQNYYLSGLMKYFDGGSSGMGPLTYAGGVTDGGGYLYLNPKYSNLKKKLYKIINDKLSDYDVVRGVRLLNHKLFYSAPDYSVSLDDGIVYYPYFTGENIFSKKVPPARKGTHRKETMLLYTFFRNGEPVTEHTDMETSVKVEDIGSIMLFSSNVYPPNFLDGSIPKEICSLFRGKCSGLLKTLNARNCIKYRLKISKKIRCAN